MKVSTFMNIMSFNIKNDSYFTINKWHKRKKAVLDIINKYRPDIIGIQELTDKQMKDFNTLDNYHIIGESRNKKLNVLNEKSAIAYDTSKYQLLDSKTIWLSKTPDVKGSKNMMAIFPRICTFAKLKDKEGNIIHVFNTHLDHLFSFVRFDECLHLAKFIKENSTNNNVIIMGDFNTNLKSKALCYLKNNLDLIDCYQNVLFHNTHHGFGNSISISHLPIDYIFLSKNLKIENTKIIDESIDNIYPSDHYPILCQIKDEF